MMKILLVGNHPQDGMNSRSMTLFAEFLERGLSERGHQVRLVRPATRLWRSANSGTWRGKWSKYVDQFVCFQPELRQQEAWADLVHICDHSNAPLMSYLAGKPCVATCHDVIGLKRAQGHYTEERASFLGKVLQAWTANNLRTASHIACVSQTVERELKAMLQLDDAQIRTVYNGLNFPYRRASDAEIHACLSDLGIPGDQPLVLHVGSDEWKKNRRGVAEIFVELKRRQHPLAGHLAFAGPPADREIMQFMESQGLGNAVTNCGQLSGAQLRALYSHASLFLFPSLYEGFGWPIIEAQACGALVATSNRDPMTEVAGKGAILIDPEDSLGAANQIVALTEPQRAEIRCYGVANAERFSPARTLAGYEALYESVLSDSHALNLRQWRRSPILPHA